MKQAPFPAFVIYPVRLILVLCELLPVPLRNCLHLNAPMSSSPVPGKLCSLNKAALCSTCQAQALDDPSLHLLPFSPPCNWANQAPRPPKSCTEGRCWVLLSASQSKPICPKSSPAGPACPAAESTLTSNGIPCYCQGFPRKKGNSLPHLI
ncbi:uncharacterized protein ACIBXB_001401 isoform 2-T4 [Morphnus guianensis]